MTNPIIYVVLNGELKMSPGKAAAQAVHASMMLNKETQANFRSEAKRTVIVLEAKDAEQIKNLHIYLEDTKIDHDYYIDEGYNEVTAYSATALAAGPIASDDLESREIFKPFDLYGGHITVKRVEKVFDYTVGESDRVIVPNNVEITSGIAFRVLKRASK